MSTIPPNNLPIYLQNYTVTILCRDVDTVCPDSPIVGGCSGTVYGCCPDGTTVKQNESGTNCLRQCGTVLYSTVGLLPSNERLKRVWNLNLTGTLTFNDNDEYVILYNFSQVEYAEKTITFENILSGTIVVCGRVLDASRVAEYDYCDATSILKIRIKKEKLPRLKRETNFSMNLLLDDLAFCEKFPCPTSVVLLGGQNILKTTESGDCRGFSFDPSDYVLTIQDIQQGSETFLLTESEQTFTTTVFDSNFSFTSYYAPVFGEQAAIICINY
jgi:hypothetical protein